VTRTLRALAGALTAGALVVGLSGGPALAAGTGDIELVPASRDGQAQSSFTVTADEDELRFDLVNLVDEPRTARLYAASANRSEGGGIGVGDDGSAPWLDLPDTEITLGPGETRSITAPLDLRSLPEQQEQLGAVVLEAAQGAVTVRVATLVTVEPRSALPLPLWAVGLAVVALALVAFGLLVARRREHDDDVQDSELVAV
jgi:hypothetical protein